MLNQTSVDAVHAACWRDPFIKPLYESYCFVNLPTAIQHLLTGEGELGLPADVFGDLPHRYDAVLLFFVDAFGWRFFEKNVDRYPFLQHFLRNGVVSKLTSMFPSTTAAHVTCIHTGLPPAQSGVYEWYQYEPSLGRMIAPLLFSLAGEKERDTLVRHGIAPAQVFPSVSIYHSLKRAGAKPYLFHNRDIVNSAPTRAINDNATMIAYKTLPEVLVELPGMLAKQNEPSYYFVYYSAIDTIGHEHGPSSDHIEAEIDQFLVTMERIFLRRARGSRALFMLTADHGQVEVDPRTTIYLNHTLRGFRDLIATNARGQLLTPAGSPRDYFLHVKPERLDEATEVLGDHLKGKAAVVKVSELIAQGLFGSLPSELFLKRVGNLVVLPFKGESVYYYEREKFDNHFFGHHGGLTREEMEIPLLVCEL